MSKPMAPIDNRTASQASTLGVVSQGVIESAAEQMSPAS
jgi:hypothetical protein